MKIVITVALLIFYAASAYAFNEADFAEDVYKYGRYFVDFVGMFSILASLTPTLKDDNAAKYLVKLIDILGFNILFAKNNR